MLTGMFIGTGRGTRILVTLLAGCMLAVFIPYADVDAEEGILKDTPIEVSTDIAVYSKYIWRGFALDDDPVMQSGVYISGYGIEASVWGSFDIDSDDALDGDEVDYSVGYTYTFDKIEIPLSLSAGYTYYDFPPADTNSQEFYLGAGLDVLLSPTFTWYHDFEEEKDGGGKGDYFVAELGHSIPLGEFPVTLDLNGHVAYNHELFIVGDGGDIGLGAGLTLQLAKNASLTPNIGYSIPFGDLEDANDGNQDDEFFGGAIFEFSF